MAYPYTNEEITDISQEVASLWFGWITKDLNSQSNYDNAWYLINGYSDPVKMWEPFCLYAEKYTSLAKESGMRKEMLSREQIAIVSGTIRKEMIRASNKIRNSPELKKYEKSLW